MATALAGCVATAATIPLASNATATALNGDAARALQAKVAVATGVDPDAAIFALCKEWRAKNEEYERVCQEECPIQNALTDQLPERPVLTDPIPMGRGRAAKKPINSEEGWTSAELSSIAAGKPVLYSMTRMSKSGDRLTTTIGKHVVPLSIAFSSRLR